MRYHVIVIRPEDGSLLVLPSSEGWTIPSFVPDITDARIVEHINDEMRRRIGFETWTMKCAARSEIEGEASRIFIAVARDNGVSAPAVCQWLKPSETHGADFADSGIGRVVESWLTERNNPPPLSAPWESIGWHLNACNWIRLQLTSTGTSPITSIVQQRAWGLSCTMKVGTDAGDVYFKATPQFMAHEGRVMQAVAQTCPELLPSPLAVDSDRGWLLMHDFGGEMLHECPHITRWEEALRLFSQAQVEQSENIRYWLSANIPDRRLGRMVEMIDPLIASCGRMLTGGDNGLSDTEIESLGSLSLPLKLMCARLAQVTVPHTLVHGDLGGNIVVREDGYTFFDWTDVCVSHPFFEMATISGAYFDESVLKDNPDADDRLRDAYLEPWIKYEPMERLIEEFDAARPLAALHQAMTYMWILTNISPDARPELEGGLLHWVRYLLRLCGRSAD